MAHILGISSNRTDSSACIFEDGKLVCAVEEERFTRVKHDGRFPINSIKWCLQHIKVNPKDISVVGISWDYAKYISDNVEDTFIYNFYESLENKGYPINWQSVKSHIKKFSNVDIQHILKKVLPELSDAPLKFYSHHDCHAASSYCYSGYDNSLALVFDEKGENACTSVYIGESQYLKLIDRSTVPNSLGLYYAAATQFLNLRPFIDEGTFMALATNGKLNKPLYYCLKEEVVNNSESRININPAMISKPVFDFPRINNLFYTENMVQKLLNLGIYIPREKCQFDRIHKDFAYTIQKVLEELVLEFIKEKVNLTTINRICIAGGVGLNCTLISRLLELTFRNKEGIEIFVPPWCHDAGGAIGAAVLAMNNNGYSPEKLKVLQFPELMEADWGPIYNEEDIIKSLEENRLPYFKSENITKEAAKMLSKGDIIAWFQGQSEFGPRALGQRSILSHPSLPANKAKLIKIKKRLSFRPFSPSILEKYASRYYNKPKSNISFMTIATKVKEVAFDEIQCTINTADNTIRPQTVAKRKDWLYSDLIEEFYKITGIPAVLNTSFNIQEPIVLTPEDAISTFKRSDIDSLIIGNFVVQGS